MRSDSTAHKLTRKNPLRTLRVPAGASVRNYRLGDGPAEPVAVTAAAQVLASRKVDRTVKAPPTERWQNEAWDLRDEIGELRFIGDRQARGVSQVELFVGKAEGPSATPVRVDDAVAEDLQTVLFGSRAATEQFLYRAAQQLIFNGDSCIHCKMDGDRIATFARSVFELQGRPGDWAFSDGVGQPEKVKPDELVIRCWRPDPRWYGKPDAPVRAVLPVARELRGLTMFVSAQIDSRLAGAGLLLVPDEIESAWQRRQEANGIPDEDRTTIEEELTEYFLTPIKDRDSAASVVPFILAMPGELTDKIKLVSFANELDEHAAELRDEAIRRVGLGMDSDPSILLGQGSGSHWNGWLVDNNEIRYGIEPLAAIICHSLTVGLLRPLLERQGVPDVEDWQIWYDVARLKVRDDRSKDAQTLYGLDVVSQDVLLEENGFSTADAPKADEYAKAKLWKVMQIRPDLITQENLAKIGVDIGPVPPPPVPSKPGENPPAVGAPPTVAPEAPDGPPVMGETEATENL